MAWLALILAGILEIIWVVGIKYTADWSKLWPSLTVLFVYNVCLWLLSYAMRSLEMGLAYAVWVGSGMVGVTVLGILLFKESASPVRLMFIVLIVAGVIGLKLTQPTGA